MFILFVFLFFFMFLALGSRRWKAVPVHVGRLHLEICTVWRADPPLPEAYGTKAVPLPPVPAFVLTIRPSVTAHEATLMYTMAAALYILYSRQHDATHTEREMAPPADTSSKKKKNFFSFFFERNEIISGVYVYGGD